MIQFLKINNLSSKHLLFKLIHTCLPKYLHRALLLIFLVNTFSYFSKGALAEQILYLVVLPELLTVVIVKRWHFEHRVQGFPRFLFTRSDGRRDVFVNFVANDLNSLAMHLAFHFLDLLLLYTDLDSSVVHLRY